MEEERKGVMKERSPWRELSEALRLTRLGKPDVGSGSPESLLELRSITARVGKFERVIVGRGPVSSLLPKSSTLRVRLWIWR